jgi:hypothetical protein
MVRRRKLFATLCGVILSGVAGCTSVFSGSENEIQDTDGDGVIDSEDYAPRDPDIQRAEQIKDTEVTPTETDRPTGTQTKTATETQTATETPVGASQFEAFTISIDTEASYLHVDDDDQDIPNPDPVQLEERNISPGDQIIIEVQGTFVPSPSGPNTRCQSVGVFSRSDTLQSKNERHRVPGAINAGPDYKTRSTFDANEPTDIPEDFFISGDREDWNNCDTKQVEIQVPSAAKYLFICVEDTAYSDNVGELSFEIRPG